MANKDYFDRIADALQIISGDDSHVDDIDKNMDYYKRIAQALENIAQSGSGGGGSGGNILVCSYRNDEEGGYYLTKTWQEIHDAAFCIMRTSDPASHEIAGYVSLTNIYENGDVVEYMAYIRSFGMTDSEESDMYTCDSPDGYPKLFVNDSDN